MRVWIRRARVYRVNSAFDTARVLQEHWDDLVDGLNLLEATRTEC
jgi:hypothetical protein